MKAHTHYFSMFVSLITNTVKQIELLPAGASDIDHEKRKYLVMDSCCLHGSQGFGFSGLHTAQSTDEEEPGPEWSSQ